MAGRPFLLVSKHSGHALSANSQGAPVVVNTRNEHDPNQLWYEDGSTGTIRSQASQLCLTVASTSLEMLSAEDLYGVVH